MNCRLHCTQRRGREGRIHTRDQEAVRLHRIHRLRARRQARLCAELLRADRIPGNDEHTSNARKEDCTHRTQQKGSILTRFLRRQLRQPLSRRRVTPKSQHPELTSLSHEEGSSLGGATSSIFSSVTMHNLLARMDQHLRLPNATNSPHQGQAY